MALFSGGTAQERSVSALQAELERTELRLEEVAAYYRGELEAVRQRAEDELLRVRADEAGRRRRAEEEVTRLGEELRAARDEADKATRRYQELLARIEEIEAEGRVEAMVERDRFEASARAAWQTAEDEVARLDREMAELQRELDQERADRERVTNSYQALEEQHQRGHANQRRLVARVKKAFKLSEQRRRAVEAQLQELAAEQRPEAPASAAGERGPGPAEHDVEVDPAAGWGTLPIGDGDDLADEFLMMGADRSFEGPDHEPAGTPRRNDAGATSPRVDEVSDSEAEQLMVALDVDRKVARRQAREQSNPGAPGARREAHRISLPVREPSFFQRWWWALAVAATALVGIVGWLATG